MSAEEKREQALSTMAAAEERFRARDFPAAWMLALQARSFFPSLLGLHIAIAAYDVLRRSAAAPGDWRGLLDVGGGSPDHEAAVEARYRNLCTVLTDPARAEFAAAADVALKIVEQAWRKFQDTSQSPKSHLIPVTRQSRPSSSPDDFSGMQVDGFTPESPTLENFKKKKEQMSKPPLTGSSSSKELTTTTRTTAAAADNIGKKLLVFSGGPTMPTSSCPRCDDWFRLVMVGRRQIYLRCTGCGGCYSPRCGQCRGLHKPKHVSGLYVLLVCGDDCSSPVLVRRVQTPPSTRLRTPTLADGGAPSHVVLQSSIYGRSRAHVSDDDE